MHQTERRFLEWYWQKETSSRCWFGSNCNIIDGSSGNHLKVISWEKKLFIYINFILLLFITWNLEFSVASVIGSVQNSDVGKEVTYIRFPCCFFEIIYKLMHLWFVIHMHSSIISVDFDFSFFFWFFIFLMHCMKNKHIVTFSFAFSSLFSFFR